MGLEGLRAFCFIALKHHARFLVPVARELERRGMGVLYLTAPAEIPFEITLAEEGLAYRHTHAYLDAALAKGIERAYREVRRAWREKILGGSLLHHFTLPVQDKIVRMHVENFYLFRRMFEVERPDLVLALHELNSWGKILGYLSHEFAVPFVTFQEGLYYGPPEIYRYHTEYSSTCLVWGEATREVLVRAGGSPDKIAVVGNTHLDAAIAEHAAPARVRETRAELEAGGRRIVTLLMGGLGYQEGFEFPAPLLEWARGEPRLLLVCKWHPVTNKLVRAKIEARCRKLPNVRFLQDFDTYRLIAASDVCAVFGASTTGLEALAFGKPLVEVSLPGLHYSFSRLGVAESAEGLESLPHAVERAARSAALAWRRQRVEEYLARNLGPRDGKSVERAVGAIVESLAGRAERARRGSVNLPAPRADLLFTVVVPVSSRPGTAESLIGVAEHTPRTLPYECVVVSALGREETLGLTEVVGGDLRVVFARRARPGRLWNRGASAARGRYLCFLPPGVVPLAGWLEAFLEELESSPRTGVVGGKVLFPDGLLAHAGIAVDENSSPVPLYRFLPGDFPAAERARETVAVTGCLVVRRETFAAVGGADEAYLSAWHDLDLCLSAGLAGWRVRYTPQASFLALAGGGPRQSDRNRFFGKWAGTLRPDQEGHWAADGLDRERVAAAYRNLKGALGDLPPLFGAGSI